MNDREKLIDLISDVLDFVDWGNIEATVDHLIANGVVIQKQGEWVAFEDELLMRENFCCTNCKGTADGFMTPYCPNCGAKMKEVK